MKNPYEQLYIYYFEGIPKLDAEIEKNSDYLGNWVDGDICFMFFSKPYDQVVNDIEQNSPDTKLADTYQMTGEQWHGDKIEPYFIHNLHIHPPWQPVAKTAEDEIHIVLDPGVVFGTGRHQTTEDCLYLLHRLFKKQDIQTVLDIGTGTGLLALGAAALGCNKVLACDFNYLAVKTCANNIRLNTFEDRVLAFQARGEQIVGIPSDLMVANIHYDIMKDIIEDKDILGKKWLILSGLLVSETQKIMDRLREKNIHILERHCPDGVWNTLLCRTPE